MAAVVQNLERFRAWADLCPENFNHKYVLVRAEVARISRKTVAAMALYDQARDQALASNFYLDATLSDELAGNFWETLGKDHLAKPCIESAIAIYERWGATGKVTRLISEFQELMEDSHSEPTTLSSISTSMCTESFSAALDLLSMIKEKGKNRVEINLGCTNYKLITGVIPTGSSGKWRVAGNAVL